MGDTRGRSDDLARKKFLTQINSGGKDMLVLINDVLDLSKVEAGQVVLRIENVLVADVVRTMELLASKKAIRLEADVAAAGKVPADRGKVPADRGKLKQMLLNLLSNAVKFTPEGGHVTIGAQRLADTVEISVTETRPIRKKSSKHSGSSIPLPRGSSTEPGSGWHSPNDSSSSTAARYG